MRELHGRAQTHGRPSEYPIRIRTMSEKVTPRNIVEPRENARLVAKKNPGGEPAFKHP
jgi:hypothetical protein